MGSTKALLLASVVAFSAVTGARAADLPPPPYIPPAEPVEFGGWYLRGDVGVGIASSPDIRSTFYDLDGGYIGGENIIPSFARTQRSLGDSEFIDIGVGYQFNNWFRVDATGEYRTSQHIGSVITYQDQFGLQGTDSYDGTVQSSVFLINGYVDLGTWYGVTPFVGAGVGAAYNRVSSLIDTGHQDLIGQGAGFGVAPGHEQFDLAYAAMAGLSYAVTPNVKLELAYRYLNLGDAQSGATRCVPGGCTSEKQRYSLESQDIRLGMRWLLSDVAVPAPEYLPPAAPIVRKY